MANYFATHWIKLESPIRTGNSSLSWTSTFDIRGSYTVHDTAPSGELDQTDTFAGGRFSGFYIDVDGKLYGVFLVNTIYAVPYIKATHDIYGSAALASNITTTYATNLANAANCFFDGTRVASPLGERPIEGLRPGDLVVTADGAIVPVVWVWRQDIVNIFRSYGAPTPIRITAEALGPGCPARDLIVTADHGLCIDGSVINAGALVNGTTICNVPPHQMPARFSYWHIETEAHCPLLAEGCPAESFAAYTPRAAFADHAAYLARHGRDRPIPEMALPRITTARQLPLALRIRLGIDRAA